MSAWPYRYFTRDEMACRCCGKALVVDGFMRKLDALREVVGFPLPATSGYRCPDHNDDVSGTGRDGPHTTGAAVDIAVAGHQAHAVLEAACRIGFAGIGLRQSGDWDRRIIHLDDAARTAPAVWTY